MIITPKLLNQILLRYPSKPGFLPNLAREQNHKRIVIEQINRSWVSLPNEMKIDPDLQSRIQSVDDSIFRGALSEIFTATVLSKLGFEIQAKPKIRSQTPDFQIHKNSYSFLVESACVGPIGRDREIDRLMTQFESEIKDVRSTYLIFLVCLPIPNTSGNLHGIGRAVQQFLDQPSLGEPRPSSDGFGDPAYWVEYNGVKVGFRAVKRKIEGEVYAGAQFGVSHDDSGAGALEKVILNKTKKYKFPFLLAANVDSHASIEGLLHTMIGVPAFSYPMTVDRGAQLENVRLINLNDGLWGRSSPKVAHLQGVLFIKQHYALENGISLSVHLLKNPFIEAEWGSAFDPVPELLNRSYEGNISKMPSLIFTLPS